jgi:hypothetical protein
MKSKFFLLFVLFLAIGLASFAQTAATSSDVKKDTPAQTTVDQTKSGACAGHETMSKAECKWVDANNDGICDTCKKTAKECQEKCATPATTGSKCNPAACGSKEGTKSSSCCPSKGGKK